MTTPNPLAKTKGAGTTFLDVHRQGRCVCEPFIGH